MTTNLGDSPHYGATFPGTKGGWQRYCPHESRRGHRRTTIGVSAWGGTGRPGSRQCAGNWSPQTWHTAGPPHLATREPPSLGDGLSPFSTGKQLREGAEKDGTPAWPRGVTPSLRPCYFLPSSTQRLHHILPEPRGGTACSGCPPPGTHACRAGDRPGKGTGFGHVSWRSKATRQGQQSSGASPLAERPLQNKHHLPWPGISVG